MKTVLTNKRDGRGIQVKGRIESRYDRNERREWGRGGKG
jgi:hypothetical protein